MKICFLDRDGVLNHRYNGPIKTPEDVEIIDGVRDALKIIANLGYWIVVITNQSGLWDGRLTHQEHLAVTNHIHKELPWIYNTYTCQHSKDAGCYCRKPNLGLIFQAVADIAKNEGVFCYDLEDSILIGDAATDMELAERLGILGIRVRSGNLYKDEDNKPNWLVSDNLRRAADLINLQYHMKEFFNG